MAKKKKEITLEKNIKTVDLFDMEKIQLTEKNKNSLEKVDKVFGTLNNEIIYRKMIDGTRHYIRLDDKNNVTNIAVGTTSMIGKIQGVPDRLLRWACDHGSYMEYRNILGELAGFGTFCHSEMPNILNGEIIPMTDDDALIKRIIAFQNTNPEYMKYDFVAKLEKYKSFMPALYVFLCDMHNQGWTVVACEIPLANWIKQISGCLDLVFQKEDQFLIVDYKTGMTETEEHELQLLSYRELLNHNFPKIKLENISIANVYNKNYKHTTLIKYLKGTSKTTPYNFVKHEINQKNVEWLESIIKRYKDKYTIEIKDVTYYLDMVNLVTELYTKTFNK